MRTSQLKKTPALMAGVWPTNDNLSVGIAKSTEWIDDGDEYALVGLEVELDEAFYTRFQGEVRPKPCIMHSSIFASDAAD